MTAPTLNDLFDPDLFDRMLFDGYVRTQVHPTEPLAILNYTEKAAYEGVWNQVTLACRGLIHKLQTGEIVARPFQKFFNHGQAGAPTLDLHARAVVTDKMDGSLGILYPLPGGGHAIATRGSFASEQAVHATEVWQRRYADRFEPEPGFTWLFEIVYPANRIVVDYGDLDDLVLLGAVDIATGRTLSAGLTADWYSWPGPVARGFPYLSLAEALAAPPRPNAEGLVVHLVDTDERVKLKQEDYVALHRIVTGLSARTVWQHLVDDKPHAELIEPLPDEFHDWVRNTAAGIMLQVDAEEKRLTDEFYALAAPLDGHWPEEPREARKAFAALAVQHPDKWAMFALLDMRDIRLELLKRAKPEPGLTPSGRLFTEDNA